MLHIFPIEGAVVNSYGLLDRLFLLGYAHIVKGLISLLAYIVMINGFQQFMVSKMRITDIRME